jgi:hypothetical protein
LLARSPPDDAHPTHAGPSKVVEVNLPNIKLPTLFSVNINDPAPVVVDLRKGGNVTLVKLPNVTVNAPIVKLPPAQKHVIDLTALGPKKVVEVQLPQPIPRLPNLNVTMTLKPVSVVAPGKGVTQLYNVTLPQPNLVQKQITLDVTPKINIANKTGVAATVNVVNLAPLKAKPATVITIDYPKNLSDAARAFCCCFFVRRSVAGLCAAALFGDAKPSPPPCRAVAAAVAAAVSHTHHHPTPLLCTKHTHTPQKHTKNTHKKRRSSPRSAPTCRTRSRR